jgi:hypothetical protein
MAELVGVKSPVGFYYSYSLKREALLFDRISVPHLAQFLVDNRNKETNGHEIQELEWLLEQGIVFEPEPVRDNSILDNEQFHKYWEIYLYASGEAFELNKEYQRRAPAGLEHDEVVKKVESLVTYHNGLLVPSEEAIELITLYERLHENALLSSDCIARLMSIQLRVQNSMDAHPIFDSDFSLEMDVGASKTDVIEVVLNLLPMPDDSVPWEHILDYRADPDTRGKFLALRRWMGRIVRDQLSPREIEEELEFLIHQYQSHLHFHKMKVNFETWRTIVAAQADIIPNLIRLKWGDVLKPLFALRHRRIELMELELTAPGNEIAYIVESRESFS